MPNAMLKASDDTIARPSQRIDTHSSLSTLHSPLASPPFATEAATMSSLGLGDSLAIMGSATWPKVPWWRRISPSTFFVLLSAAIAVLFLVHELVIAGTLGFPTDESWIEQVYARNFFHHVSFEYNAGKPTAGPTSPFWIVLLSLAANLFHDPILAGKLLGTIFLFLTGYYAFRLLRAVELDYASSLLGGVLIVTSASLGWAQLSGLESTLSSTLVAGGLWWYFARPRSQSHWLQSFISGAILGLGTLTRPEVAAIFAIVLIDDFVRGRIEVKQGLRTSSPLIEAMVMLLAFVVVVAPVAATSYSESGSLVPLTFYTGLGKHSALRLVRHGNISQLGLQIVTSFRGLWAMIQDVYLPENPLWLLTIPVAIFFRLKNRLIVRDRIDHLFSLSIVSILVFPYLHAFVLGRDDWFGASNREVHFILPIYALASILSIYTIVRYGLLRSISPKQMLLSLAVGLVSLGLIYNFSATTTSALVWIPNAILIVFTTLLLLLGLRHSGILLSKKQLEHFVTEEERNRMQYLNGNDEHESKLPAQSVRVLRAGLLLLLAWNISQLPNGANQFANNVRVTNREMSFARSISYVTQSWDVIATNHIGVVAWGSDRSVVDLAGHLTNTPTANELALGESDGLLKTIVDAKPQYVALFGDRFNSFVDQQVNNRTFQRILPFRAMNNAAGQLLKINYSAIK